MRFSVSFATTAQDSLRAPDGPPARAPPLAYFLDYPAGDPRRSARRRLFLAAQAGNPQRREDRQPFRPLAREGGQPEAPRALRAACQRQRRKDEALRDEVLGTSFTRSQQA